MYQKSKAAKRQIKENFIKNIGSWDKGDVINRIIGVKRNKKGSGDIFDLLCKVEWKQRATGEYPLTSYVPMQDVKEMDPDALLSYFEFCTLFFGT